MAFISSVIPTRPASFDVVIQEFSPSFAATGLKVTSVVRLAKLATLEQALVTRRLGWLDHDLLTAVDSALLAGLGIDISRHVREEYQRLSMMLQREGEAAVLAHIQSRQS